MNENSGSTTDNGAPETNAAPETTPEAPQTNDAQAPEANGPVPYERFKTVNEQRKAAESTLKALVEEMTLDLPENLRALVPNLPPAEKAAWIRQAKAAGLFMPKAPPAPELDTKRPNGQAARDLSTMNPTQMLGAGYK